jgi:hypothetical protein
MSETMIEPVEPTIEITNPKSCTLIDTPNDVTNISPLNQNKFQNNTNK